MTPPEAKFPPRVWLYQDAEPYDYRVRDDARISGSTPYISLKEHQALTRELVEALEKIERGGPYLRIDVNPYEIARAALAKFRKGEGKG